MLRLITCRSNALHSNSTTQSSRSSSDFHSSHPNSTRSLLKGWEAAAAAAAGADEATAAATADEAELSAESCADEDGAATAADASVSLLLQILANSARVLKYTMRDVSLSIQRLHMTRMRDACPCCAVPHPTSTPGPIRCSSVCQTLSHDSTTEVLACMGICIV